jgi:hypothetical protein
VRTQGADHPVELPAGLGAEQVVAQSEGGDLPGGRRAGHAQVAETLQGRGGRGRRPGLALLAVAQEHGRVERIGLLQLVRRLCGVAGPGRIQAGQGQTAARAALL